ncbi:SIR2 family protein [Caulobacter sp. BK020]|uniref:SIR2 family NAD-dependent protein deacylase n=1 Tax=Caulobacter sp. BK020 TaxID=2512117 RepID=UPI0010441C0F|nr:SIR2 family protein [Caulobacter sp. BK020]TCS02864.1 SIR2-like protein [Caulobacter sp. BK020]
MATAPALLSWCEEDRHRKYSDYRDFNDWFDGAEGVEAREAAKVAGLASPSKAFFVGDREGYGVAFEAWRQVQRNLWLSREALTELCADAHWADRNTTRFDQLCDQIALANVVPFIGAGLSQPGGFPTWKDHLRQQGRTAGLLPDAVEAMLAAGDYEGIVHAIEAQLGQPVFRQELRDAFSRNGTIPPADYLIAELFSDTLITTNYDRLLEQAFDVGGGRPVQVLTPATILTPPDADSVTILKLHGDIVAPGGCILSRNQYAAAYGDGAIDPSLPIPQALDYYFRNSSLLFLGCSLNQDRTVQVFEAIMNRALAESADLPQHFAIEQLPSDEAALIARNAALLRIGVTPIWFPAGAFEFIEEILRLARNEMHFRR